MRGRLLLSYLSLTVFVLAVLELPLAINEAHTERQALTAKVQRDAAAIAGIAQVPGAGSLAPARALRLVASRYRAETGARVVITGRSGRVIAHAGPARAAGNGAVLSQTTRIGSGGRLLGAVRISYPTSRIGTHIHRYWLLLGGIAVVVLATALAIGFVLARWVARPLLALEGAARRVGHGDLAARALIGGPAEVGAVAAAFNSTTARLERMVTAQREFVADASHQLRSPLTALRLRLENLEPALASGGRAGLESALAEVERLAQMIDGLLVLAQAEHRTPSPTPRDAAALVATRVAAWAPIAEERRVVLCVESSEAAVTVLASPGHLEQVLDNLLENALAVAPPASTVAVWCRADTGAAEIGVRDHGPGMAPEDRVRAFDRFWTGGPAHGTGLGLAVVRRLVEGDGGTVSLHEAPDGGLEAIVRLPAAPVPEQAPAHASRFPAVA